MPIASARRTSAWCLDATKSAEASICTRSADELPSLMGLAFDVGFGGLALVVERVEVLLSAPEFARQSQPAKFRFPDHEMAIEGCAVQTCAALREPDGLRLRSALHF